MYLPKLYFHAFSNMHHVNKETRKMKHRAKETNCAAIFCRPTTPSGGRYFDGKKC